MTPSAPPEPGVYRGTLRHRRRETVPHEFTVPLFMVLLDVDRIPELLSASRLTGYERPAWASYREADHVGDPALPLRTRLAADAARSGLELPRGPVFLLTHLRYLGWVFNPISFFYCHDEGGCLALVMAEVRNTFGGSHDYWLRPLAAAGDGRTFRARASKSLYVSPFLDARRDYDFALTPPGERLVAHIDVSSPAAEAPGFDATLSLERRPWNAREIRRALIRHPWMTARVVGGIHVEAAKLWWKGVPVVRRRTPDGVGERAAVESAS